MPTYAKPTDVPTNVPSKPAAATSVLGVKVDHVFVASEKPTMYCVTLPFEGFEM